MATSELKPILEVIQIILTCLGILGAGFWALFVFLRQRENKARIEFTADIIFHKKIGQWWIVELLAFAENKGKIQHKLYNLEIDFSSIGINDIIELNPVYNNQVNFPNSIVNGSFLNIRRNSFYFIEPGVKSKYSYITKVPADTLVVNFHTKFHYNKRDRLCRMFLKLFSGKNIIRTHTAEATKAVPNV